MQINRIKKNCCVRCLWANDCNDKDERCEFFEPLDTNSLAVAEYELDLKERVEEYGKLIREFD